MKNKIQLLTILLLLVVNIKAQSPYKIDTVTGSHLLDNTGQPVRNDKNWDVNTLNLSSEFVSGNSTTGYPNNLNYWSYLGNNLRSNIIDPSTNFYNSNFNIEDGNDFTNSPEDYPGPYSNTGKQSHYYGQSSGINSCILRLKIEDINGWYPLYPGDGGYDNTKPTSWPGLTNYQKKLIPITDAKHFSYTSGMLQSNKWFKYGWFEIKCRIKTNLPNPNNNNYNFTGVGYNFWLFGWQNSMYSEIDIFETDMSRGLMTSNTHLNLIKNEPKGTGYFSNRGDPNLSDIDCNGVPFYQDKYIDMFNFKTFSLEWLNNNITTYYNNERVMQYRHKDNPNALPSSFSQMKIIAGFGANYFCRYANNNTLQDIDYELDYIKVYKLICTDATDVIQSANTTYNFSTYSYGVKNNIIFGGTNCVAKVSNGSNVSLRAKTSIELKAGFEVEAGGEFYANICECTN